MGFLDELYTILQGFGISRSTVDWGIAAVLAVFLAMTVRLLIDDPRAWDVWGFGVFLAWAVFYVNRYINRRDVEQ